MLAVDTEGTHPSTQICLAALQWLQSEGELAPPLKVLDMGCGNGILAVTSASLWESQVLAVDISEKALDDARARISEQTEKPNISLLRSDSFAHPAIASGGPYDLIISNMLAQWHIQNAKAIHQSLKPGGYGILCGVLVWLAPEVKAAWKILGIEIVKEFTMNPWTCCIVRKPS